MSNVLIATPMFGGMCSGEYTRSSLNIPWVLKNHGHDVSFAYLFNNSIIQSARNTLATIALRNSFTHLFFIDADIKFDALDVLKLVESGKDIIAGVYPKKQMNWERIAKAAKDGVPPEELPMHSGSLVVSLEETGVDLEVPFDQPVEVNATGTGFMCIRREVLETLEPSCFTYYDPDHDQKMVEFFKVQLGPSRTPGQKNWELVGEDYYFCNWARRYGYKIHVLPSVKLGHVGQYLYEGGPVPVFK